MGFNKRHIDKERIISAFKYNGAKGITDLYYKADAIFMPADSPVCHYIDKIMSKDETIEYKQNLINVYMTQLLEGLYKFK
tara:strand:+ start:93 stop:332 length:240 start_codon:yes stop_codon:yes gene_type:complete